MISKMDLQSFLYFCTIDLSRNMPFLFLECEFLSQLNWKYYMKQSWLQIVQTNHVMYVYNKYIKPFDIQLFKTYIHVTCDFISISSCWYICPLSYPGNQYTSSSLPFERSIAIAGFHCHIIIKTFQKINVKNQRDKKRWIFKQSRKGSGLCDVSCGRYWKKCFTQIYNALYGDGMFVSLSGAHIWWPEAN